MRLQELILENYRGFNQKSAIPLDGRVLLFYGQNGRGKSSVFGALEMALFPEEKIGELRRDFGSQAPLTNRFNSSPVGRLELRFEGAGTEAVVQEVQDKLDEMQPAALPLHREIAGHRRRIFFTQDLLRGLMLGGPAIRYRRLNEMLGCDAYDRLVAALGRWAEMRGVKIREQDDTLKRLDDVAESISSFLRERGMDSSLDGLMRRRFDPVAAEWLAHNMLRSWKALDEDLYTFLATQIPVDRHPGRTLMEWQTVLEELVRTLREFSKGLLPSDEIMANTPLPARWSTELNAALDSRLRARKAKDILQAAESMQRALQDAMKTPSTLADELAIANHRARAAEVESLAAEHAWVVAVDEFRKRAGALLEHAEALEYVRPRLAYLQKQARVLGEWMPTSVKQVRSLVRQRRSLLYGVRYLYDALIQLAHAELQRRTTLVQPLWKQHYGQIAAYAHFQNLSMDVQQEPLNEDAMSGVWSLPRQTVRFLVSDPDDKKAGDALPMQSLLSEGQLNCAVVALALALSEVKPPPMKVIALDDPFVSWDDVNMENFLAAVRGLAWKDWTIILSTCDARVVASFRKNMETLGEEFPSITYTFRDWDKERGPRIAIDRVPHRQSRDLRDLTPEVFERELL
ncbi:MAG TPA: AAA family ATPase [Symbiobacteriaceae bacterium]|jgi:hypothetical protein